MLQKLFNVAATLAVIVLILVAVDNARKIGGIDKLSKRTAAVKYEKGSVKVRVSAWPTLGQDETIALAERLQGLGKTSVTVYCSSPDCRDIQHDLDDAFQIADWPSEFETGAFMPPEVSGVFVGPPGAKAEALAKALVPTFGPVAVIDIRPQTSDVGVMFGKRTKAVSPAFEFK